jgi:hypothetical protein
MPSKNELRRRFEVQAMAATIFDGYLRSMSDRTG